MLGALLLVATLGPALGGEPAAPGSVPPVPASPPPARAPERTLDVDFVDADLHAVLRFLADAGDVNLVVADDVQGSVTLRLKRVTWREAFDAVLMQKGLVAVAASGAADPRQTWSIQPATRPR